MIFHYFTKKWKWFCGRYAPSGIRVWRKLREKTSLKKRPLFWKIVVRTEKQLFTKGSTNRWIWHLYNVFRSAKPIRIQPIIPFLMNIRKNRKTNPDWFELGNYIDALLMPLSIIIKYCLSVAHLELPSACLVSKPEELPWVTLPGRKLAPES